MQLILPFLLLKVIQRCVRDTPTGMVAIIKPSFFGVEMGGLIRFFVCLVFFGYVWDFFLLLKVFNESKMCGGGIYRLRNMFMK